MRSPLTALIVAVAAAALLGESLPAADPPQAKAAAANAPQVTRVFHLQRMEPGVALTLLRTEVGIRKTVMIPDRGILVVSDTADRVDQSEDLLRQRGAEVRAVDPHQPLELGRLAEGPMVTRVFRVGSDAGKTVVTVLRAIYQMRGVSEIEGGGEVSAESAQPILDASEALLREMGLLVEPAGGSAE